MVNNLGLSITNLSYCIGKSQIFKDFSIDFQRNKVTILSGPSGCGKTTLCRLISGLDKPESGEISFDKIVWSKAGQILPPWKRDLDMLFQADALWPNMSIIDQIKWVRKHRNKEAYRFSINEITNELGIDDLVLRYPTGLSGGEARRCQLARVLASESSIILLDEPLAAQDDQNAIKTANVIKHWTKVLQITSIIVTHNTAQFNSNNWNEVSLKEKN